MTRFTIALSLTVLAVACARTAGPAAAPPPSENAWAVVNGREISRDDVEKAYRRAAPDDTQQQPSEEEAYTAKLNLLNELIVQDILLAKAKELKIELPESELDAAYKNRMLLAHVADGTFVIQLSILTPKAETAD